MRKILILTGAGLSAESGLKTFRDADGLWESFKIAEVCTAKAMRKNPQMVMDFYNQRRSQLTHVVPNAMHKLLAEIEFKYPSQVWNLTQNVDDLLERAGCKQVIHLHGTLRHKRCEDCGHIEDIGYRNIHDKDYCTVCDSNAIRHNVVLFDEPAPMYRYIPIAMNESQLLIVIGTSSKVVDVVPIAAQMQYSVFINPNLEEYAFSNQTRYVSDFFDQFIQKKATESVDELRNLIHNFFDH